MVAHYVFSLKEGVGKARAPSLNKAAAIITGHFAVSAEVDILHSFLYCCQLFA